MKLRFFFDAGSGVCLWAGDDATRDAFGYPVSLEALPLSEQTIQYGQELIDRFDTSIDWNNPGRESPWTERERAIFLQDAAEFHRNLNEQLGAAFEVKNEVRT